MVAIARVLAVGFGFLLVLQGAVAIAMGEPAGATTLVAALVIWAGVAIEWRRSRTDRAERAVDEGPLPASFRSTHEVFVDPTSRRRVRVWVDPATGERRYRADG